MTVGADQRERWLVLGDDHVPIKPVQQFLVHLDNVERSPNTLAAYAYHLKAFFEFLQERRRDWTAIGVGELADFVAWLRSGQRAGVTSIPGPRAQRSERSVNAMLAAVATFYDFHGRVGTVDALPLYSTQRGGRRSYKPLLYGIGKSRPVKRPVLGLKTPRPPARVLTRAQVEHVVTACSSLRDTFLICLLYETGMRIGQALGLRHEDVRARECVIRIIPRSHTPTRARAKTREAYAIDVPAALMDLYIDYLTTEYGRLESDFVFVNLWKEPVGAPMTYKGVSDLFGRLSKKTGVKVTPHMLRHTHATELIADGWEPMLVQKRLGHSSVQTTINTYVHVPPEKLTKAYKKYLDSRNTPDGKEQGHGETRAGGETPTQLL